MKPRPRTLTAWVEGVRGGDRAVLGRAITLVESTHPAHRAEAGALLNALMPHTGGALRVGITGVPGAGKSTFIERLGLDLIAAGHRVAVLAVDPSSTRTGGSILGDKTRMSRLAVAEQAFIRPSPAAGTLGGVASHTREAMLLCEAAGYDVVLVETVGVGQSEVVVAGMTDFFLVLLLPGAGDELQGIKRGLMELADALVVNKADGDNAGRARLAASMASAAVRLLHPPASSWVPPVLQMSALEGTGLAEVWAAVLAHQRQARAAGAFTARRAQQQRDWMWTMVDERLRAAFRDSPSVAARLATLEAEVLTGARAPTTAADELVALFLGARPG